MRLNWALNTGGRLLECWSCVSVANKAGVRRQAHLWSGVVLEPRENGLRELREVGGLDALVERVEQLAAHRSLELRKRATHEKSQINHFIK